ncbi:phage tail tape measure protein, lambda family [Monaibacterium marinum]|uniref:Phage tail tape measure protein, lambda family n=1 Tax=Pontivivens marinum TaxID=1690039 RepID=A0A2C9CTH1_9RHOB|nr:phage tail tape measure protein [Monaibacterium marinum]SOH94500.1 phage tail tape measure protein, lambda family [Monaibacterium marinum]
MSEINEVQELFAEVDASIASTETMVEAFRRELDSTGRSLETASAGIAGLDRSIGTGLRGAFDALVFDGARASDAMRQLGQSISSSILDQALKPVQNAVGSSLSGLVQSGISALMPFANGGVMSGGRPTAFAKGGVVNGATSFPMRGGMGLMGEAGPEAIMPLTRGADGALGVKAAGGGGSAVHVTMNISSPDVDGFRKSRTQVAAEMSRALSRGQRNM